MPNALKKLLGRIIITCILIFSCLLWICLHCLVGDFFLEDIYFYFSLLFVPHINIYHVINIIVRFFQQKIMVWLNLLILQQVASTVGKYTTTKYTFLNTILPRPFKQPL